MVSMTVAQARKELADVINHTAYGKQRMTITRRGKQVAALVPIEDLRLLEALEQEIDLKEAHAALAEADRVGAVALDELKQRLGL